MILNSVFKFSQFKVEISSLGIDNPIEFVGADLSPFKGMTHRGVLIKANRSSLNLGFNNRAEVGDGYQFMLPFNWSNASLGSLIELENYAPSRDVFVVDFRGNTKGEVKLIQGGKNYKSLEAAIGMPVRGLFSHDLSFQKVAGYALLEGIVSDELMDPFICDIPVIFPDWFIRIQTPKGMSPSDLIIESVKDAFEKKPQFFEEMGCWGLVMPSSKNKGHWNPDFENLRIYKETMNGRVFINKPIRFPGVKNFRGMLVGERLHGMIDYFL